MTPTRWRKIEEMYDAALPLDAAARAVLLESADPESRSLIERMLSDKGHESIDLHAASAFFVTKTIMPDSQFGPYRLGELIGVGGMGAVYSAVDTRLDREERILHSGPDQAPLEFIRERARGQRQRPIQGKDAGHAGVGVTHTDEFDGSKDCDERAGTDPAMRVEQFAVLLLDAQRGSHVSVAALLQVGLKEQALHLAASRLLLTLNLVEGELKGAAGTQPGLEQCEPDSGGRGAGRSRGCDWALPPAMD